MGKLIYSMLTSLDGYVADEHGRFGWSVDSYATAQAAGVTTYLYGRRMYETMVFWETAHTLPDAPPYLLAFARQWQAAEKIVYSRTLETPSGARTRILDAFDPEAVRRMKVDGPGDITINGPELAAHAAKAGLIDEFHTIVCPVLVGGGKAFFPPGVRSNLRLLEEHRFENGVVALRYARTSMGEALPESVSSAVTVGPAPV